jgi:hypothetical protein
MIVEKLTLLEIRLRSLEINGNDQLIWIVDDEIGWWNEESVIAVNVYAIQNRMVVINGVEYIFGEQLRECHQALYEYLG